MIDSRPRQLLRLVHELLCLCCFVSPETQSGSRRKRRRRRNTNLRRCFFVLFLLHPCGCVTILDFPIAGGDNQSVYTITSRDLLHPVNATLTIAFGKPPASLPSVSARASVEMGFLPDPIPESVYLIYPGDLPQELFASQPPLAAAFVVRVSNLSDPRQPVLFLVTARHVVDPRWAQCSQQNPDSIELRLSRRSGSIGYEKVSLQSGSTPTFFTSSDSTVDLALIPLDTTVIENLGDYKILDISSDDLLAESDRPFLRQNLPINTASLPASFSKGEISYPIRNWGSISDMRDDTTEILCGAIGQSFNWITELVDQGRHSLLHLWFINANVSSSLTGAPVFVDLDRGPDVGTTRVLLGIQSVARPGKGLLGITPSFLLRDLISATVKKENSTVRFFKGGIKLGGWNQRNRQRPAQTPFEGDR